MMVETVLPMLTVICHLKSLSHRRRNYFKARLAFTMALCNLLVPWDSLPIDNDGLVPFSMTQLSLKTSTTDYYSLLVKN